MKIDTHCRIKTWRTADFRDYQIRQMETSHITHSINLIRRAARAGKPWRSSYLIPLMREVRRRTRRDILLRLTRRPRWAN